MKVFKKYSLEIIFLTILPLIITLFILPNLPDNLIMHFNLAGEADRIGNKNELIILHGSIKSISKSVRHFLPSAIRILFLVNTIPQIIRSANMI